MADKPHLYISNSYQLLFKPTFRYSTFVFIFNFSFLIKHLYRLTIRYCHAFTNAGSLAATNTNLMRPLQITFALLIGGLALWTELRPIKESALFTDWLDSVPFWMLCALTVIFLVINSRRYFSSKRIISFLPLLLCVTSLFTVILHQKDIEKLDNSPTKFAASTYDIGSDGGFVLDFKANGHLKAEKRDHWAVTYYWGRYSQNHDTISLDIPLNFKLGRQALLTHDSLHFIGDTTKFLVFRQ